MRSAGSLRPPEPAKYCANSCIVRSCECRRPAQKHRPRCCRGGHTPGIFTPVQRLIQGRCATFCAPQQARYATIFADVSPRRGSAFHAAFAGARPAEPSASEQNARHHYEAAHAHMNESFYDGFAGDTVQPRFCGVYFLERDTRLYDGAILAKRK